MLMKNDGQTRYFKTLTFIWQYNDDSNVENMLKCWKHAKQACTYFTCDAQLTVVTESGTCIL